jgi:alkylation response protein AidB-like acyl-CoA dehydrogenase
MNFQFNEEQQLLRRSAREFAESVIAPRVQWMEEMSETPMDVVQEMGKLGLMGVCVPQAYGGTGLGSVARMIVLEEIGRVSAACAFLLQCLHLSIDPIVSAGNEEQKKKYLPGLATGGSLAAMAVTESTGGSDPASMRTQADRHGDHYVLNGRKVFITNAHVADSMVVVARTGEGSKGLSAFIVEMGMGGVRAGRKEHKFGLHGAITGEVIFEDCRVPAANLLGEEGQGLRIGLGSISRIGRTGTAGTALGLLNACLETSVKHANERKLYGEPIAKLQAIQWHISDIWLDLQVAKLLCYQAAWLVDQKARCDTEIAGAKLYTTEAAVRSAKKTMDIYGGYGYLNEYPVQRYYRDAQCLIASAGTSEAMRITVARGALG